MLKPKIGRRLRRVLAEILLAGAVALVVAGPAVAGRRVALVIGNADYEHVATLRNPLQDAAKITETLHRLDFDVLSLSNLDRIGMERALRRFSAEIDKADVALFYYSGHAVQVGDRNYLVPVSTTLDGAKSLSLDTLALQDMSVAMKEAGAKIQLLFLDACRDNPFGEALDTSPNGPATRGLAHVTPTLGSLIVFATAPGQVALDGNGDLSPFTTAFARYAVLPKLEIRQVLDRVRAEVAATTDNRQVPWDSSSLTGAFYLVPQKPAPRFDRFVHIDLANGAETQPLRLKAPVQDDGGAIEIAITRQPNVGRLALGSRRIAEGDRLTPADFANLAYRGEGERLDDTFTFKVSDAWGNEDDGTVLITRAEATVVAKTDAAKTDAAKSGVAKADAGKVDVANAENPAANPSVLDRGLGAVSADAVSLVGLGPNLFFRTSAPVLKSGDKRPLMLASNVPFGQIMLGDRVIEKGRTIALSDVTHLAFAPPVGSDGKHLDASFTPVDDPAGAVKVAIDVKITDCDRLAADRLDKQAVTEGVLTGQVDVEAALKACETAVRASPKTARFVYQLGRVYAALGRNADALKEYHQAADLGHVRAVWALGNADLNAQPPDFTGAKALLEKAAASGDAYAIHSLGQIFYDGRGVPQDLARAKAQFESAAGLGHTFSMNMLGRMYQRGEGVAVNTSLTHRYWEESARRGDMYGIDNLGYLYLDGVDVPKDPARALVYFREASDLGHPEAPNNIGRMYLSGLGVPVDVTEAVKWYRLGADRGDAWAAFNLGDVLRLGLAGQPDLVEAGYYYARAAASTNRLDAAELARKQLALLDRSVKPKVLQRLQSELDPAKAPDKRGFDRKSGAKGSTDAALIGAAQALLQKRSARADLF